MKKYTNPQAHGYLLEAKACEKVVKELNRIAEKYQRAVDKEAAARQTEFEAVMQYTSERQIQDDYGWDFITGAQYYRYLDLFRHVKESLENAAPTPKVLARNILLRIIGDIEADRREWEFSALTPAEQATERKRREQANQEWKEKIAEIKKRRGIIEADTTEKTEELI